MILSFLLPVSDSRIGAVDNATLDNLSIRPSFDAISIAIFKINL